MKVKDFIKKFNEASQRDKIIVSKLLLGIIFLTGGLISLAVGFILTSFIGLVIKSICEIILIVGAICFNLGAIIILSSR